jgi:endonuclease/exonuclease/phosphatase family metal-dependent hydrolase
MISKSSLRAFVLFGLTLFAGCATPQRRPETRVEELQPLRNASRAPADHIRIATFNIQNFGKSKVNNAAILSQIVAIVQAFDVVAIQEISDKSGTAMKAFQKALDPTAQTYQLVVSDRTGRQPDDKSSQEQYAFVFRKDHLQLLGAPELYPDTEDAFQREPFLAHFKCVNGNFSFVLINIHTQPERAVAEIGALDSVMHWAKGHFAGEDDFIALGDFNGSCSYAKPAELDALKLRGPDYLWIVPDDADSNLAQIACAYDRIVITQRAVEDYAGHWDVYRVFQDKKISDHWPVWAEFYADHDHN